MPMGFGSVFMPPTSSFNLDFNILLTKQNFAIYKIRKQIHITNYAVKTNLLFSQETCAQFSCFSP